MTLSGSMLIGASDVTGDEGVAHAINPATNQAIPNPPFGLGGGAHVDRAARLAALAFDAYRRQPMETRAALLETIADNIEALGDTLIERAHAETGLPVARLQGERGRTTGQLRLFASVVRQGHFLRATLDTALPQRQPLPRSDLRMAKLPLGPVAVFGASNFPLAFSVAGGDTASALAAGCPVIVKAHSAHLGTSELVGRAIQQAVAGLGLHEGVFSLLIGAGRTLGESLVAHPSIKAVGFTGSRQGGVALQRIAQQRAEPIPVYAEMSSINPVFLLPGALAARAEGLASAFADSLTLGAGQFCTNPGLVLAMDGPGLDAFVAAAAQALGKKPAQTMLTPGIYDAYCSGKAALQAADGVSTVAEGLSSEGRPNAAQAALYLSDAEHLLAEVALQAEVFGPAALLIRVQDEDTLHRVAEHLEGQLTATLLLDESDHPLARTLLPVLERKAGRILVNGFPTGVEVCHAMVHGGPYPATTNAMYTSVGAQAIDRFLRPVCYQDVPEALLPAELLADNPLNLWRLVDGAFKQA